MTIILNQEIIKEHIIHRYENLLLDSISMEEEACCKGELSLTIAKNDDAGRDIFLKNVGQDRPAILIPVYMEILALASIVVSGKLADDEMAIFAGISQFSQTQHHFANDALFGQVSKVSDKAEFLKYIGELSNEKGPVCQGVMTAFFTKQSHKNEKANPSDTILQKSISIPVQKEHYGKQSCMVICDELLQADDDSCVGRYEYPTNHPLIKGHFPGNPLMMGVMQWMGVEDTLCAYLEYKQVKGVHSWSCNAQLFNQDNILVADIKQIKLKSWINVIEKPNQVEISTTKRLAFRYMVKPSDQLYIQCSEVTRL